MWGALEHMIFFKPSITFFDAVINHPSVRPSLRGTEKLTSESLYRDPMNVILASEGGVVLFKHEKFIEYEGHVFCLEGHRGRSALQLVAQGLKQVFDDSKSSLVRALAPTGLPQVGVLCRRAGFKLVDRDLFGEHFVHYGDR